MTAEKGTLRPLDLKKRANKLYKLTVTVRQTYVALENSNIIPQNRESTQNHRKKKETQDTSDNTSCVHSIAAL